MERSSKGRYSSAGWISELDWIELRYKMSCSSRDVLSYSCQGECADGQQQRAWKRYLRSFLLPSSQIPVNAGRSTQMISQSTRSYARSSIFILVSVVSSSPDSFSSETNNVQASGTLLFEEKCFSNFADMLTGILAGISPSK